MFEKKEIKKISSSFSLSTLHWVDVEYEKNGFEERDSDGSI